MRRILVLLALATAAPALDAQTAPRSASPHGALALPCATCHSANGWTPAKVSSGFSHAPKTFPLDGAHATLGCLSCHQRLDFTQTPRRCSACHEDRHNGELGSDCARCHTTRDFVDRPAMLQAHNATRFPLRGAHVAVTCESCHTRTGPGQPRFAALALACAGCHAEDARAVRVPDHQGAGFTGDCAACHTNASWRGAKFDHATTTFALSGAHLAATCDGCHADRVYRGKSTECVSCHRSDYDQSAQPPHAGFPTACVTCHTTVAWSGATFSHDATRFALTGGHRVATCAECHGDGIFAGKPTECASCHRDRYDQTRSPPHAAAGFSTTCSTCHGTVAWLGTPFDHATTTFPLTGAHRTATCAECHGDGTYRGRAKECASCHLAKYGATTNPPHGPSGFSTDCAGCHNTTAWPGTPFNHGMTRFPLSGAHVAATCANCHGDGVFRGKSMDCASCHQADYASTAAPPHASSGFSTTCATCHNTTAWLGSPFNHSQTRFPLTGAHLAATCANCHADGIYSGKATECVSCHLTSYNATRLPPHSTSGIGTACSNCHSTAAWPGGSYDHAVTSFPLTGAHLATTCVDCHADGVYRGKPTACLNCHQSAYSATTRPAHAINGIGTACANCHTTAAWPGATFDHATTAFPLTGAHIAASCASCHGDGVYRGKPTSCVSCHQSDFSATSNPNHTTAHFPTTCASCHTTATWLGATFDHDGKYFQIYSGDHRGKWTSCATCHTDASNYKVFTCLTCHLQKDMDDKHKTRAGYRYDSYTCYSCHPTGSQ